MGLLNFIVHSYIFRKLVITTAGYAIILWITNIVFDKFWEYDALNPVTSLEDFYGVPKNYDNLSKVNIKLVDKNRLGIECNEKFKINKDTYGYYDTVNIQAPKTSYPVTNKIFLRYENNDKIDSIYLVLSKADVPDIYWNQIFYTSVIISGLNYFSVDTNEFRINKNNLVSDELLSDNDTLINGAIDYFNLNKDNLGLAECGTNSQIFKNICDKYQLPCRIITLQGGNALYAGYNMHVGYPAHVVCEVYSSKYHKWYVVDPTYGSVYKMGLEPLDAIEIANREHFWNAENIIQDSVMVTRNIKLGKDYFRYYENVYLTNKTEFNFFTSKFFLYFYRNYIYKSSTYTFYLNFYRNGLNYLVVKSSVYFILFLIYLNVILILISKRLLLAKHKK